MSARVCRDICLLVFVLFCLGLGFLFFCFLAFCDYAVLSANNLFYTCTKGHELQRSQIGTTTRLFSCPCLQRSIIKALLIWTETTQPCADYTITSQRSSPINFLFCTPLSPGPHLIEQMYIWQYTFVFVNPLLFFGTTTYSFSQSRHYGLILD